MAAHMEPEQGPGNGGRATKVFPTARTDGYRSSADDEPYSGETPHNAYARPQDPNGTGAVDAEVVDEWEPGGASRARDRLRDSVRGFFGAKTAAWTAERERQRTTERRRAADERDDLDEGEQLLRLRAETKIAGEQYMRSLADSRLLVPGFNDEERDRQLTVMHQVYMQMMMQGCLRPLSRGVNPASIVQAVGMMVAMRLLAPEFRKEMDNYLQPLKDKIRERLDARTNSARSFAQLQADRHNDLVDARTAHQLARNPELAGDEEFAARREAKKTDRDAYLSRKWRRRMEQMERRDRGHREMFTPESAAMTEVALMENAFWRMRAPGADSDEIYASYRAMRKRLRDQMADDGLEREDVVTRARMIIGERMKAEPELRLMFNGLAHGRIVRSAPHAAPTAGGGTREVWTGEFEDQLGRRIPDDAMLTLRRPMDAHTHQAQLSETMAGSMLGGLQRGERWSYADSVLGYLVGFAARRTGLDTRGLPVVLQQRLDQSESMLASMAVDGLEPDTQQEIYSNAFTDAMEEVAARHPGIEENLVHNFGHDWQATLQAAVDDPARFVREHQAKPRVYYAGADHTTQHDSDFGWGYAARQTDPVEHQPA